MSLRDRRPIIDSTWSTLAPAVGGKRPGGHGWAGTRRHDLANPIRYRKGRSCDQVPLNTPMGHSQHLDQGGRMNEEGKTTTLRLSFVYGGSEKTLGGLQKP
ncbi:uncharacterized protein SPSK_10077 [Sporothrix schenckii 1099-18]|uniref:Uncharacterized protein n=1 Tax=Sporothrix schenckii 1099-18 TaxID=1397361 RepID=A0A0F2M546_SPOSC|nr:uncharacterized protein SPSK_10077 [Sporothrix schenckii 1099-18]KJR84742.1 hypothetical protein SPSK_10077 [Sporothrix schenckii 1099-18]